MILKLRHVFMFAALGAAFVLAMYASANITQDTPTPLTGQVYYKFFATSTTDTAISTTTSAVSTDIDDWFDSNGKLDTGALSIAGAEKVTFYFGRTVNSSGGNSKFEVEVTPDGTTWYDFDRLLIEDGSNTATTSYTIVNATTTVEVSLDLTYHAFKQARCVVTETTDGTHTCAATVEF